MNKKLNLREFKEIATGIFVPSFWVLLLLISSILIIDSYCLKDWNSMIVAILIIILSIVFFPVVYGNSMRKTGPENRNIVSVGLLLILIAGLFIFLYPNISNSVSERSVNTAENRVRTFGIKTITMKRYGFQAQAVFSNKSEDPCVLLYLPGDSRLKPGDIITTDARLKIISPNRKKGYEVFLFRKGIRYTAYLDDNYMVVQKSPDSFKDVMKQKIGATIGSLFSPETAALLKALYFGNKNYIDKATIAGFKRAGVLHALAASGLHVGIIASIPLLILGQMRINRTYILLSTLMILFFYLYLTDMPVSLVRACLMFAIYTIQEIFFLNKNIFNTLFITAIIVLIIYPFELFNPGFQLSFGATFGILLFHRFYKEIFLFLPDRLASSLSITVSAQVLVIPVIIIHMGELNLTGVLSNIILVPLVALILILSIAANCCSLVWEEGAKILGTITDFIYDINRVLVEYMAGLNGHFTVEGISPVLGIAFLLLLVPVVLVLFPGIKRKNLRFLPIVAAFLIAWLFLHPGRSTESCITVIKHKDNKIVLVVRNNRASLIGQLPGGAAGKKIAAYINRFSIEKLTLYIKTPDFENMNAYVTIAKNSLVSKCFLSSGFTFSKYMKDFFRVMDRDHVELVIHDFSSRSSEGKLNPDDIDSPNGMEMLYSNIGNADYRALLPGTIVVRELFL
ncbi:MAG: ComEC family competence protein [bacterium]|nr:ComEC family competence protein [bacterium]